MTSLPLHIRYLDTGILLTHDNGELMRYGRRGTMRVLWWGLPDRAVYFSECSPGVLKIRLYVFSAISTTVRYHR